MTAVGDRETGSAREVRERVGPSQGALAAAPRAPLAAGRGREGGSLPPAERLVETPSQTAGPYLHIGLLPAMAGLPRAPRGFDHVLAREGTQGERIRIEGRVLDGIGAPVRDAVVELWQPDAAGRFPGRPGADPAFRGWGRCGTDFATGLFAFDTVKPGPVPGLPGHRPGAPHALLWLAARGINAGLLTRLYFGDEAAANAEDPVLGLIDPPERRATLVAAREARGDGAVLYRHEVRLQGERETVFFDA